MSGCEARHPTPLTGVWFECGLPVTAVYEYTCACGHKRLGGTCEAHRPVGFEVGCARCFDEGHECRAIAVEVNGDAAAEVPNVCDRCGRGAIQVNGRWMHGEAADAVFCAVVFPRERGVGAGGSE